MYSYNIHTINYNEMYTHEITAKWYTHIPFVKYVSNISNWYHGIFAFVTCFSQSRIF